MKKALLLICVMAQLSAFAQIPNNGFENWINKGTYMDPQGWWTANDSIKSGSYYPVTQSTDHYPAIVGSYSIRLESGTDVVFPPANWANWGLSWTGDWNGNNYPVFAVSGHPNTFCGYYKWLPHQGDTMDIHCVLYKNGVSIAQAELSDSATHSSWTSFTVAFNGYVAADSGRIFMSCYPDCKTSGCAKSHNSVLYVDNLSFDSLLTATPKIDFTKSVSIYPNPSRDVLYISLQGENSGLLTAELYNITGRRVLSTQSTLTNNGTMKVDVRSLHSGVYLIKLITDKGSLINKFIKE